MSCMVMNPEPLAALANAVETRLNCDYSYWGFEAPDSLYCWLAKTGRKGRQNKIGGTQTEGEEKEREANWRRKWGGKGENRRE